MKDEFFNYILDSNEFDNQFKTVNFDLLKTYTGDNFALKIDFKNDFKYSINCLKKLIYLKEHNVNFISNFNDSKIKYVICNYNKDILACLKAIEIDDLKSKYSFIYDYVFNKLDIIWKSQNYCDFCEDKCIATRMHKNINQIDRMLLLI